MDELGIPGQVEFYQELILDFRKKLDEVEDALAAERARAGRMFDRWNKAMDQKVDLLDELEAECSKTDPRVQHMRCLQLEERLRGELAESEVKREAAERALRAAEVACRYLLPTDLPENATWSDVAIHLAYKIAALAEPPQEPKP